VGFSRPLEVEISESLKRMGRYFGNGRSRVLERELVPDWSAKPYEILYSKKVKGARKKKQLQMHCASGMGVEWTANNASTEAEPSLDWGRENQTKECRAD